MSAIIILQISELSSAILLDKRAEDQNGSSTAFILNEVEGLTVDSWTMLTTSSSATLTVNGSTPLTTCRTSKVRDSATYLVTEHSYWANSQAAHHPETDN
jgi:hypothetical protein